MSDDKKSLLERMVLSLAFEAQDVKRILFDSGYQVAHNRVAEVEAELLSIAALIAKGEARD